MDKFQNKYRIPSARLQTWDYGSNGAYFITICTQNRQHFFGEIVDSAHHDESIMHLNDMGEMAEKYWMEIPQHFPFISLGNFVIMPNHMHGILIIDDSTNVQTRLIASPQINPQIETDDPSKEKTRLIASLSESESTTPETPPENDSPPTTKTGGITGDKNPMFHDNISRIIRWYKGRCSFEIRKIHSDFGWQSRFYDHIIRNSTSFENIQNYISNNPNNWNKDKFHG
jgi:REP element-mobilizing transposase RayT